MWPLSESVLGLLLGWGPRLLAGYWRSSPSFLAMQALLQSSKGLAQKSVFPTLILETAHLSLAVIYSVEVS